MNKEEFFKKALEACSCKGESGKEENCFREISMLWSVYLHKMVREKDVAMLMVLMKVARVINKYNVQDSILDIAGYAACANELEEN